MNLVWHYKLIQFMKKLKAETDDIIDSMKVSTKTKTTNRKTMMLYIYEWSSGPGIT